MTEYINPMQMGAKATGEKWRDFYQTPPFILEAVTNFFGPDWFDPCPANPDFDGLAIKWPEKTYINPPFSQYKKWSAHGWHQPLEQIWMSNHCHDTEWWQSLPVDAMCLLFDRVVFIDPRTGKPAVDKHGKPNTAVAQRQTLRYKGSDLLGFKRSFQHLGTIVEVMG